MKKTYISPSSNIINILSEGIIAASSFSIDNGGSGITNDSDDRSEGTVFSNQYSSFNETFWSDEEE